ncbi:exonuclease family protein [Gonapodya prolifera JEL478]|uniref:Exonuclease family protein n=1 Tax=Gonapodya prolifera (strain JEL478) TaxID=1344416 RepID=A0A139A9X2_GONPJ|nr:exonuclease family protein [Gonapodya prolifera JEL478]|eukprot:KXS13213.1 exonuclease family protein [Gonapodya prolifera JEL478]
MAEARTDKAPPKQSIRDPLVWIDCEMTGLNPDKDHILEICVVITDADLNVVAEGPEIIIRYEKEVLDQMGEWCVKHHGESGLTARVLDSKTTLSDAQKQIIDFIKSHVGKGEACLAGNSVHADKMFLVREFPEVVEWLHYRIVDVSTLKELVRRWYPDVFTRLPQKKLSHRARDDILESIEELKWYRRTVMKKEKAA